MKRYFYLVCFRYAPGNWQHIESFTKCLLEANYSVRLLISKSFSWMNASYEGLARYTPSSNSIIEMLRHGLSFFRGGAAYNQLFQKEPPAAILLVMWHPLNFVLARSVKSFFPRVPIIAWLHEPYKDEKITYGLKAFIILLVEWFQTLSLRYVDVVILHSGRAQRLFKKRYPSFSGSILMVPLQFHDHGLNRDEPRQFISFLGRADRAKGIETFFCLVEGSAKVNSGLKYQIVTSSNIENFVNNIPLEAKQILNVTSKTQISNEDLRLAAGNSVAVLALYKETMQSGVIPVALMKGTPVVGTNIEGITEWIEDKKTGVIVSTSPTSEEIIEALHYIREHFSEMSRACRLHYLETFDDRNWERYYGWLQELIQFEGQTFTT